MRTRANTKRPELPKELDFQSVQDYKAAMREYDAKRILAGEVTSEQIQRENSWVQIPRSKKILNFPEAETG